MTNTGSKDVIAKAFSQWNKNKRALRDVTFPMHADGAEGGALKD